MNETYINQYRPDTVLPPGDTLMEVLDERDMSQAELAQRMGRPTKTINEIIKGKTAITPDTSLQLERVLGISSDFWINLEVNYQKFIARLKEDENLIEYEPWIIENKFPVSEMIKRGWIINVGRNKLLKIRELLKYFSVSTPKQWDEIWYKKSVNFRRSQKSESKLGAISVWIRQGQLRASEIECSDYNEKKLKSSLEKLRSLTNIPDPANFVPEVTRICAESGVAVVFVQTLKGSPVSGVSEWLTPRKAMIMLSVRHGTDDHLWFTLFHELAHVIMHNKKDTFVDFSKDEKVKSDEELEADDFASELLIPSDKLNVWLANNIISKHSVQEFAMDLGICPGILVGRLQYLKKLEYSKLNGLKRAYYW